MRSATYDADIENMYGTADADLTFTETAGKIKLTNSGYGYSYYPTGLDSLARLVQGLFSKGEQAVWFDPSDISTLYQDAAGTTPVTAMEQPVGLMLDKSKGLVLGPELVTNGDFSNGTAGWSVTGGATAAVTAGVFVLTAGATSGGYYQDVTTTANSVRVTLLARKISGSSNSFVWGVPRTGNFNTPNTQVTITGSNWQTISFVVSRETGATGVRIYLQAVSGDSVFEFDSISVRELPGNHCVFKAGTGRPVLSARYNLYVGTETLATQNITTVATNYKLTFTGGTGTITLSGTATGTYSAGTHTITCTAGTLTSTVSGTVTKADFRAANDGIGLPAYQRVTTESDYDTAGFPPYLRADGTDDGGSTNSIDFTGTDKITVFAGVRKLSDAAYGQVAELSADWFGNNGSFALSAPFGVANNYAFVSKGTNAVSRPATTYVAPHTALLTGIGNISGDRCGIKVNGGAALTYTSDQGTGNYGNYPLFLFARNNASLYFNGRLYGLIVLGRAATATEIANTERYLNMKGRLYA